MINSLTVGIWAKFTGLENNLVKIIEDNIKLLRELDNTIDISIIKTITEPANELENLYKLLASSKRNVNTCLLDWNSSKNF